MNYKLIFYFIIFSINSIFVFAEAMLLEQLNYVCETTTRCHPEEYGNIWIFSFSLSLFIILGYNIIEEIMTWRFTPKPEGDVK